MAVCGQLVRSGHNGNQMPLTFLHHAKHAIPSPCRLSPKKTSSGAFTRDSRYLLWGDKYGDVLIGDCRSRNDPSAPQKPALLLGHLCSVVASLAVSPDNR